MDVAAIFDDPRLMLFRFEGHVARFVPMNRESYARSIFFDRRLQPAEQQSLEVPLQALLEHLDQVAFVPPRLRFIHHFAHSGSTLLARALDRPGNLVHREPVHLRQLGVANGAGTAGPTAARAMLKLSLAMLGKRFAPGSTVIVKGNVPISLLGEAIAGIDPGQPAVLLYFPLEDYCTAVMRTPKHQAWVEQVTGEIALQDDPLVSDISQLSVAEKAAALWYSMIKRFERMLAVHPAMQSLDANQLFERPAEAIAAASSVLEAGLDHAQAEVVAKGPLLSTYSKNPNIPFNNATRRERRDDAKAQLKDELRLAHRWVEQRSVAVPASLARPLLDESARLL